MHLPWLLDAVAVGVILAPVMFKPQFKSILKVWSTLFEPVRTLEHFRESQVKSHEVISISFLCNARFHCSGTRKETEGESEVNKWTKVAWKSNCTHGASKWHWFKGKWTQWTQGQIERRRRGDGERKCNLYPKVVRSMRLQEGQLQGLTENTLGQSLAGPGISITVPSQISCNGRSTSKGTRVIFVSCVNDLIWIHQNHNIAHAMRQLCKLARESVKRGQRLTSKKEKGREREQSVTTSGRVVAQVKLN